MQVIHKNFTFCVLGSKRLCHGAFLPAALQPDSVPRRRRPATWHRSSRTGENVRRGSGGEEPALWLESQTGNWARSSLAPRRQQPSWIGRATDRARQRAGGRADGGAGAQGPDGVAGVWVGWIAV